MLLFVCFVCPTSAFDRRSMALLSQICVCPFHVARHTLPSNVYSLCLSEARTVQCWLALVCND